ncbi:MAG: IS1380 family transposase [Ignavibacteriaceae bacterium]
MKKQLEHSTELITAKAGLLICDAFEKYIGLPELIDSTFPKPGSNRAFAHSKHVGTLIQMFHDGAGQLKDVRELAEDKALQKMIDITSYPGSDALGNWLRRQGSSTGVNCLWKVMKQLFTNIPGKNFTLDIDATIIEANKGDAEKTYNGTVGYQPMLGIIAENNITVCSEFRKGNCSPKKAIVDFIACCRDNIGDRITYVRSDSAAFQKPVVKYLVKEGLSYSITAQQNEAVLLRISEIPEEAWSIGIDAEDMKTSYSVAETDYTFIGKRNKCRLVVKREKKTSQLDMFDPSEHRYWAILTNLPSESYSANQVILTHQMRGQMEKSIGELKHQCGLDHLPCGQFSANAMYFTIGILAANLLQLLKQDTFFDDYLKASIKTFRYKLIHLPARVIKHGRVLFIKIVSSIDKYRLIESAFLRYSLSPMLC